MIQDIFPSNIDISFKDIQPSSGSYIMVFKDSCLLSSYNGKEIIFPVLSDLENIPQTQYIFSVDGRDFFITSDLTGTPPGFEYMSSRDLRKLKTETTTGIFEAFTAFHLHEWYENSRFCGRCGQRNVFDKKERAMTCPDCGNKIYPRINPAVIVGVINNDKLLLTGYRTGYAHNALVAGFVEIGESLEDTVRREVMEECGLRVRNIRYYKSQPWGVVSDILAGFFCYVDGDDEIKMDKEELRYAEWVKREDIVLQPNNLSLTNEMMTIFKQGRFWSKSEKM